jgi:hypothetical protein
MTPREYCEQNVRRLQDSSHAPHDKWTMQIRSVLSFFAQRNLTDHEFVAELKLMAESAEHSGRPALAAAVRTVLADWATAPPGSQERLKTGRLAPS